MANETPGYQVSITPTAQPSVNVERTSYFSAAGRYANSIWSAVKPDTGCKAIAWVVGGTVSAMGGGYFLLQAMRDQNVGVNLAVGIILGATGSVELGIGLMVRDYAKQGEREQLTPGVNNV